MKFVYKVKDNKGAVSRGNLEAGDIKNAAKVLRERGLTPITIAEYKPLLDMAALTARFSRASTMDVANFTRQLATMITAGLPLTDALNLLKLQSPPGLAPSIGAILADVQGGVSLSDAMSKHPRVFSRVYIALIRAGEAAGVLEKILNRLAESLEKSRDFQIKVKGAMIYPVIVFVGMLIVMVIMMVVVIPRLTSLYTEFGAELPATTSAIVALSSLMSTFWWLGIILIVGIGYTLKKYIETPAGHRQWDKFLYQVPVLGPLLNQTMLTELTRTLSLLVGAGVSIVDALNISAGATGNVIVEVELHRISRQVEKGFPISVSFSESEIFPILVGQMMAVGEETGKLDDVLARLSTYYETESEQKVKGLTTAIEPLIIVLLGLGVGFLIFAVVMPIYNLTSQF